MGRRLRNSPALSSAPTWHDTWQVERHAHDPLFIPPAFPALLPCQVNGESFATTNQAAVFRVQQGRRYRFRTVGGMASWALRVAEQGHNLTVIAIDGQPIQPAPADAFVLTSGERVDFVLHAGGCGRATASLLLPAALCGAALRCAVLRHTAHCCS